MSCYSASNNIHFDFPPIMDDGRNFSNWQPGAVINEQIRQNNGIKSNTDYRRYLQTHGDQIIKQNQEIAYGEVGACIGANIQEESKNMNTNTPYLFKSCYENSMPFGYENSDLKQIYLTREQLERRMVAPLITQDQFLTQRLPNPN